MSRVALASSVMVTLLLCAVAEAQTIANSVSEFSGVQGQDGWYYGYFRRSGDVNGVYNPETEFRQFPTYMSAEGKWVLDESQYFTAMDNDQQHGNARVSSREDVEHWSIRRYVAEVSGPITITGFTKEDDKVGPGDDGVTVQILLNGEEVFERAVMPEDQVNLPYVLTLDVEAGDMLDFVSLPGATDHFDCPFFTATIVAVPEPGSIAALAAGAMTLLARRRRGC